MFLFKPNNIVFFIIIIINNEKLSEKGGTVDENQVPTDGDCINIINGECKILYFLVNWPDLYNVYVRK